METTQSTSRTHPLILAAAVAVIAVCLAGIAALAGWLPGTGKQKDEAAALGQTAAVTEPASLEQGTTLDKAKEAAPVVHKKAPVKAPKRESAAVSPAPTYASKAPAMPARCNDCGIVEDIRTLTVEPDGSGLGGVAGGVVGGLLGNQVGQGRGRTAATVAGVVGGALAGNKIEKTMKKKQTYEVVVRYEDGTTQTFPSEAPPAWRQGDKVRVENGVLVSR
ncbi:MAG: hypothetical protein RugAbin2_01003 [Rugosibacter sp.]|nr:hypothetical protein [Rugosibacter sp.]